MAIAELKEVVPPRMRRVHHGEHALDESYAHPQVTGDPEFGEPGRTT
jgi:hypothetical protein